jgi:hypothetical protein
MEPWLDRLDQGQARREYDAQSPFTWKVKPEVLFGSAKVQGKSALKTVNDPSAHRRSVVKESLWLYRGVTFQVTRSARYTRIACSDEIRPTGQPQIANRKCALPALRALITQNARIMRATALLASPSTGQSFERGVRIGLHR